LLFQFALFFLSTNNLAKSLALVCYTIDGCVDELFVCSQLALIHDPPNKDRLVYCPVINGELVGLDYLWYLFVFFSTYELQLLSLLFDIVNHSFLC
jgi:hypothetical protein